MSQNWYERFGKRTLDIILSPVFAVLLLPAVIPVVYLLRREHGEELVFTQDRYGVNGFFKMYKIRTVRDVYDPRKGKTVPYVSRVGQLARWIGVDEYLQLRQAFIGQMSLVGPRPLILEEAERMIHSSEYRTTKKGIITPAFLRRIDTCKDADELELEYCRSQKTLRRDLFLMMFAVFCIVTKFKRGVLRQTAIVRRRPRNPENLPGWKEESQESID